MKLGIVRMSVWRWSVGLKRDPMTVWEPCGYCWIDAFKRRVCLIWRRK